MRITKDNIDKFINTNDWDDKDTMDCSRMYITHIEYIPDHIKYLYCGDNKLTSLPKLPDRLLSLYCYNNNITSMPKLPESLRNLSCFKNNLPYTITIENLKEHNKILKRKEILEKIRLYH